MADEQPLLSEDYGGVGPEPPTSLWDWLTSQGKQNPARLAIIATHESHDRLQRFASSKEAQAAHDLYFQWTYHALLEAVSHLASAWYSAGVYTGTLVTFVDNRNAAEWSLLFWTSIRLGMTFVPLDPHVIERTKELEKVMTTLSPDVIVVQDRHQAEALGRLPSTAKVKLTCNTDDEAQPSQWRSLQNPLMNFGGTAPQAPDPISPTSTALIMFTSGSTNLPKGCPVTVQGLTAQIAQYHSLHGSNFSPSTRHLISTMVFRPICYLGCLNTWYAGGTVIFSHGGFDPKNTICTITDLKVTHAFFVPAMIQMLHSSEAVAKLEKKPENLQAVFMAGDAASSDAAEKAKALLRPKNLIAHWGMTEGAPVFGFTDDIPPPTDPDSGTLGLGRALPGTRLKICHATTASPVPRGQHGDLHISSNATITHYLENRCSIDFYSDAEGRRWFKTGDTAMMNEAGIVFVVGRRKDIVVFKGVNVIPTILEDCLKKGFGVQVSSMSTIPGIEWWEACSC